MKGGLGYYTISSIFTLNDEMVEGNVSSEFGCTFIFTYIAALSGNVMIDIHMYIHNITVSDNIPISLLELIIIFMANYSK